MLTMTKLFENRGLLLLVALIAVSLVLVPAGAAIAGGRGHGGHWGGHGGHGGYWHGGWGWTGFGLGVLTGTLLSYPYYYQPYDPYYSRSYYSPYGYAPATRVVVRERVYNREPGYRAPTWYFCRESNAYYPYVRRCAGGWEKVPAVPPSPEPDYDR